MMKPLFAMIAMPLLVGAAAAPPASLLYDLQVTVVRDGVVIAQPRLQAAAGSTARFESDHGKGLAWSATLTATPDVNRAGMATLSWTAQVIDRTGDGTQTVRRGAATIVMRDPGKAALQIGPSSTLPPTELRVALASRKN